MNEFSKQAAIHTLVMEVRGASPDAQIGVAWVLKNRLAAGEWGKSLASVCLYNRPNSRGIRVMQFSSWRGEDPNFAYSCSLPDDDPEMVKLGAVLANVMMSDQDPTGGALFYHDNSIATPQEWVEQYDQCYQAGTLKFFKPKPKTIA